MHFHFPSNLLVAKNAMSFSKPAPCVRWVSQGAFRAHLPDFISHDDESECEGRFYDVITDALIAHYMLEARKKRRTNRFFIGRSSRRVLP